MVQGLRTSNTNSRGRECHGVLKGKEYRKIDRKYHVFRLVIGRLFV